jgi:hypothetical protein
MKRRPGRPPLEVEGRKTNGRSPYVSISFPSSTLAVLQQFATAGDVSIAAIVRVAVKLYLRKRRLPKTMVLPPLPPAAPRRTPRLARSVVRSGAI